LSQVNHPEINQVDTMFPSGVCGKVLWTMNGVRLSPISSMRTAEQGALTARGAACLSSLRNKEMPELRVL
jgi:hypothetical protein